MLPPALVPRAAVVGRAGAPRRPRPAPRGVAERFAPAAISRHGLRPRRSSSLCGGLGRRHRSVTRTPSARTSASRMMHAMGRRSTRRCGAPAARRRRRRAGTECCPATPLWSGRAPRAALTLPVHKVSAPAIGVGTGAASARAGWGSAPQRGAAARRLGDRAVVGPAYAGRSAVGALTAWSREVLATGEGGGRRWREGRSPAAQCWPGAFSAPAALRAFAAATAAASGRGRNRGAPPHPGARVLSAAHLRRGPLAAWQCADSRRLLGGVNRAVGGTAGDGW